MITNIVIIDDHQLFREGVKRILEFDPKFKVVAEGQDGQDALNLFDTYHPDVVIMDINMPVVNGIDALRLILERDPNAKVIMLSLHDDESYVINALQTGARGYLLKEMNAVMLVEAVSVVAEGGSFLHPKVTHSVVNAYRRLVAASVERTDELAVVGGGSHSFGSAGGSASPGFSGAGSVYGSGSGAGAIEIRRPLHLLTRRECEVLQLLTDGKSNRGIGEALYISEKTVKNHVSNILQKMNVNDRTQAVVVAIKNGWVEVR